MAFNSVQLPAAGSDDRLDQQSCKLLGTTALVVQGLMGIIVLASLLYKRHREDPKRPWAIWMFDVSKQVIGQMFVHGVNVLISDIASHFEAGGNACSYYFLNILIDTTLGIGILYAILHLITRFFSENMHLKGFESGQYGKPPSFKFWGRQTSVYVASLTTMKFIIIGLFFLWPGLLKLGEWFMSLIGNDEHFQVVFTMGIFPIAMNVLQFWLIDSIVKASDGNSSQSRIFMPTHSDDRDSEPIFRADEENSDDDNDDDRNRRLQNDAEAQRRLEGYSVDPAHSRSSPAPVAHGYPPTASRPTSTSPPPAPHPHTRDLSLSVRRKASLPAPLLPRSPMVPALNMTTPPPTTSEKWEGSWDGEDWAERVGEEDWTGRRIEQRKMAVTEAWT